MFSMKESLINLRFNETFVECLLFCFAKSMKESLINLRFNDLQLFIEKKAANHYSADEF